MSKSKEIVASFNISISVEPSAPIWETPCSDVEDEWDLFPLPSTEPPLWVRARLTKKLFYTIRAGSLIQSNAGHSIYEPIFLELSRELDEDRESQWARIVACGANSRLCNVYDLDECWLRT